MLNKERQRVMKCVLQLGEQEKENKEVAPHKHHYIYF